MTYTIEGNTGTWEVVCGLEVHAQVRGIDIRPPTPLGTGWNDVETWSEDVGHTLGDINASIWAAGIQLYAITYINATGYYSFHYTLQFNVNVAVFAESETLRLYCNTAGNWNHEYS